MSTERKKKGECFDQNESSSQMREGEKKIQIYSVRK